eukprot:scaffold10373_cov118-Isochrysis_galbana.AAC.2
MLAVPTQCVGGTYGTWYTKPTLELANAPLTTPLRSGDSTSILLYLPWPRPLGLAACCSPHRDGAVRMYTYVLQKKNLDVKRYTL